MNTFRLVPILEQLNHDDWQASTKKEPVLVHAGSESEARLAATTQFGIATIKSNRTRFSPWSNPELTECLKVTEE
jgi:hypothetical protein